LQEAQTRVSLAPQWAQNLRPARFSRPHFEQRIDTPAVVKQASPKTNCR
jgi:hypothetical protein